MVINIGSNNIIIEDTQGVSDHQYRARICDGSAWGTGHTRHEAVRSLVQNMRLKADIIEDQAAKVFN